MKKIFVVAISGLLCFNSCKNADDSKSNYMRNNNAVIYKALETGDVSKVDSTIIAKDAIDHGANGPNDIVGLDSIRKSIADAHTMFSNMKMQVVSAMSDSIYSLEMVRMTGTSASAASGMPVGAPVDMTSVEVVRWKDGKAVEHWTYVDPRDMMKMMGGMQPPPAPTHIDTVMKKK